ncbi:hypothetical protein D9O29_23705, partial [Pantoea vagans]
MFSDVFKVKESEFFFEVEGKTVTRTDGVIDDSLLGGNASAEEVTESSEASSCSGVDIVLNHKLIETSYDKKQYMGYLKGYLKAVKAKLEEDSRADRAEVFT